MQIYDYFKSRKNVDWMKSTIRFLSEGGHPTVCMYVVGTVALSETREVVKKSRVKPVGS